MTWNHRVVHHVNNMGFHFYSIHEVYYTGDIPTSCTADGVAPYGESPEELAEELKRMLVACSKPILDYSIFEEKEK